MGQENPYYGPHLLLCSHQAMRHTKVCPQGLQTHIICSQKDLALNLTLPFTSYMTFTLSLLLSSHL